MDEQISQFTRRMKMETLLIFTLFIVCYIYEKKIKLLRREISALTLSNSEKSLRQYKNSTANPNDENEEDLWIEAEDLKMLRAVTLAKMEKGRQQWNG